MYSARNLSFLTLLYIFSLFLNGVRPEIYFAKGAPHLKLTETAGIAGSTRFSRDGRPYTAFEGIPFAKIPERFQPSELLSSGDYWDGIRNATKPGNLCVQPGIFGEYEGSVIIGDEDCLYINVYVPMSVTKRRERYPVIVYVHPGGFVFGAGDIFKPSYFMDEDVIIVSFNYRLGVFGFLSTEDETIPGNYGLKDQVVALKWVRENIEKFGGNKELVTVNGVSGGAAGTHYLLLSPTTKGLIHRVISQCANAMSSWAFEPNPRDNAVSLAKYLKCPTEAGTADKITSEEIRTCLKKLTPEELSKAAHEFKAVKNEFVELKAICKL